MIIKVLFVLGLISLSFTKKVPLIKNYADLQDCTLSKELKKEISNHSEDVKKILDYVLSGPFKGRTYNELATFVDKFGGRLSGSQVLEESIDYMVNLTKDEGINDITLEEVEVPHWVRLEESLTMVKPRVKNMALLGLGHSVSTPSKGIVAEVIVIRSFEELDNASESDVKGKIVVYDPPFVSYFETVKYRTTGASKAAAKGAVASLVRSITPFSINTPHAGNQNYAANDTKIPTAAITVEDAALIDRIYSRNETVVLKLILKNKLETTKSRNTLIDWKGAEQPEKLVIVSGHIDSWDVGQGAMDDGGGMMISWAAPVVLKNLNLIPKRTIQTILWTSEELGYIGAKQYAAARQNDFSNINFVMESDIGTFKPTGLEVGGTHEAKCIIAEVLKLFASINATTLVENEEPSSDITEITSKGVPGAGLLNENDKYFWFHHTEGDTLTLEDSDELDLCTAFWTGVSYVIANLSVDIPRI